MMMIKHGLLIQKHLINKEFYKLLLNLHLNQKELFNL